MGLFRQKREAPSIIDLREPARPTLQFGFPTRCPECSAPGYLDSIDVTERLMYQHCPNCWTKWTTSEQELTQPV